MNAVKPNTKRSACETDKMFDRFMKFALTTDGCIHGWVPAVRAHSKKGAAVLSGGVGSTAPFV